MALVATEYQHIALVKRVMLAAGNQFNPPGLASQILAGRSGTRMEPGETRRYGISGAALARDAGCLIVPVAHNARDFFPRNGIPERPGRIRICIGPPIDASAQDPKETNLIAQAWIESKMAEISDGYKTDRSGISIRSNVSA